MKKDEFIFEDEILNIIDGYTKEHMEEVLLSYNAGNYRAVIVALNTFVLFDIRRKLFILRDVYGDVSADTLIKEVPVKEVRNYGLAEKYLLKEISKTPLFSEKEYEILEHLRVRRNHFAHPSYKSDDKLDTPTKDEARYFLRFCIESVFQRDAILSRKVLDDILDYSWSHFKTRGNDGLELVLNDKYFKRISQEVKDKIFAALWKFTFVLQNDKCNQKRTCYFFILKYLVSENPEYYCNITRNNSTKYSSTPFLSNGITNIDAHKKIFYNHEHKLGKDYRTFYQQDAKVDNSPIESLIFFLAVYPDFFDTLEEHLKDNLKNVIKNNIVYITISTYASESIEQHVNLLKEEIETYRANYFSRPSPGFPNYTDFIGFENIMLLYKKAREKYSEHHVKNFIIERVSNTGGFHEANYLWFNIKQNIGIFNLEECKKILTGINDSTNYRPFEASYKKLEATNVIEFFNTNTNFLDNGVKYIFKTTDYPNLK